MYSIIPGIYFLMFSFLLKACIFNFFSKIKGHTSEARMAKYWSF